MYLFDRPDVGSVMVQDTTYVTSGDFNGDCLTDVVLQAPGRLVLLAGHSGEFAVELYQWCPVPGFELAHVQIIYSPHLEQVFENCVAQLQARVGNPTFMPGEVYSRGALLVNWVSLFSAYPVINGDMPKLTGKGSYANYDAHFIPVCPASSNVGKQNYVACSELSQAVFHELVTFEALQNLPRYLVTLQLSMVKTVPALSSSCEDRR
eukprot:m51a1_g13772 hypothetical protein (207) ;mRNA; f:266045-271274